MALSMYTGAEVEKLARTVRRLFDVTPEIHVDAWRLPNVDIPTGHERGYVVPVYLPHLRTVVIDHQDYHEAEQLHLYDHYYVVETNITGGTTEDWLADLRRFFYTVNWRYIEENGGGGISEPKMFGDVGCDLTASQSVDLQPDTLTRVPCNIQIELPPTLYGFITARSSLAEKRLIVPNGIVDSGYRGPIFVQILNLSQHFQPIDAGDRIGQILFRETVPARLNHVRSFTYPTDRGHGGFGSTGR